MNSDEFSQQLEDDINELSAELDELKTQLDIQEDEIGQDFMARISVLETDIYDLERRFQALVDNSSESLREQEEYFAEVVTGIRKEINELSGEIRATSLGEENDDLGSEFEGLEVVDVLEDEL